jgi:hypothetical protein
MSLHLPEESVYVIKTFFDKKYPIAYRPAFLNPFDASPLFFPTRGGGVIGLEGEGETGAAGRFI